MTYEVNYFASVMPMYIEYSQSISDSSAMKRSDVVFIDFVNRKMYWSNGVLVKSELSDVIFKSIETKTPSLKPSLMMPSMAGVEKVIQTVMKKESQITEDASKFAKKSRERVAEKEGEPDGASKLNVQVSAGGEKPNKKLKNMSIPQKIRPPTLEEMIGWIYSLNLATSVKEELVKKAKKYPMEAMIRFREKLPYHIKEIQKKINSENYTKEENE